MFFCFKFLARRWNWFANAKRWLLLIFWNTDWRNCNNLKKFLHTIFTLSELVLSFVEMKANENVLHRAARRFLALDCDERDTQRRYALFFCFKFEVLLTRLSSWASLYWALSKWRLMEIVFAQRFTEISWSGLWWESWKREKGFF